MTPRRTLRAKDSGAGSGGLRFMAEVAKETTEKRKKEYDMWKETFKEEMRRRSNIISSDPILENIRKSLIQSAAEAKAKGMLPYEYEKYKVAAKAFDNVYKKAKAKQ